MNMQSFWMRPKTALVGVVLALGLGGLGIAAVNRVMSDNPPATLKLADANEGPSRVGFAPIVKKVLPSVVTIASSKVVETPTAFEGQGDGQDEGQGEGQDGGQGQVPDQLRQFFGDRSRGRHNMPQGQREQGLGSGVIVSPDGYILTNNHVVDGATSVTVTLSDKRDFKAHVVGTDPKTDIAVLKIDASGLPAIVIGDSSKIQIGDYALAVGDPFGVGKTVTMGIVSATGRNNLGIEAYEDFIQTDAPINPGNSGGALINDHGELIGINTAIISHGSEGNQGIGFAIPVNLARTVMDQILKNGKVTRAYLGIVPQDLTPAIAKAFGEKDLRGALVGDVSADSPAQKSGLLKGDIITELNGKPVEDANQLRMSISMMNPDSSVTLKVTRNGAEKEFTVKLAELPGTEAIVHGESSGTKSALAGVAVEDVDSQTARQLGVPANTAGVVVTGISPTSPAVDSGLRRGDVIQEVNRQPVKNTSDFEAAMRNSKDQTLLLVNRQGNTMYVAV